MVAVPLQFLLIAGLVLCPFRCQVNHPVCGGDSSTQVAERTCGCGNCPKSVEGSKHSPASDDDRQTDGPCQCICSGAIVDRSALSDMLQAIDVIPVATELCLTAAVESGSCVGRGEPPPEAAGPSTGRALCILHSLFLC
jgi:hypothetical protein